MGENAAGVKSGAIFGVHDSSQRQWVAHRAIPSGLFNAMLGARTDDRTHADWPLHGVEDGMSTIELDHRRLLRIVLSILAALLFLAASHPIAWAGTSHTFVLPASDAYGAADCTGKPAGCSEVVASAFCESHGYSDPIAYGKAEMTGSVPLIQGVVARSETAKIDPDAYVVTCGD
jgi:hypothetical protein